MSGKEQWEAETVAKALTKGPERRTVFETTSGIPVERLYTPEDAAGGYEERLGYPGQYPFTRGIQPTMYRGRFWTMRQYAGFATAEESNKRYRYLLEQGQTGLSIAFDLPTQIGYDSDDPMAHGEVGKVGVAIDSLADMEVLFQGIPLDQGKLLHDPSTPPRQFCWPSILQPPRNRECRPPPSRVLSRMISSRSTQPEVHTFSHRRPPCV